MSSKSERIKIMVNDENTVAVISIIPPVRSSPPEVFCKKGVLKIFAKFIGTELCESLFLIKLLDWGSGNDP